MFSKMIAGLRSEAEKVSGSNYAMLMDHPNKGSIASEISGSSAKDKAMMSAGILAIVGTSGVFGLASANMAAASVAAGVQVGAATMSLASASSVLAGLGTVAVGAFVLPVATVVAVGLLATSAVALVISKAMSVNWSKGIDAQGLAQKNDREGLVNFGATQTGLSDWLKGAKNIAVNSLKDLFAGDRSLASLNKTALSASTDGRAESSPAPVSMSLRSNNPKFAAAPIKDKKNLNVFSDYEVSDLLDHDEGKQKLVDRIGDVALAKFGVVLDPIKTREALSQSRSNESFSGKILAVNEKSGLVLMSSGRGIASVHNLRDFAKSPEVGKNTDISYKQGKMQTGKEQAKERDNALTR